MLSGAPVLTDGAWGTELQARGLALGEIPDFWNLSHPDRVEAVARAYVDAGSQVILTNTFRASRIALGDHPEVENGEVVYATTAEEFADCLPRLIEAGASFVGGCCGTSPQFIRA